MDRNNFTVINGGLLEQVSTSRKEFVSAYVTNTRLMGVTGMYICFDLPDNTLHHRLHQFFYFDAEEFGFDRYDSVLGDDRTMIEEIENAMMGGLGGEQIDLSLREACCLLQEYVQLNQKEGIPLPEGQEEYGFLLEQDAFLSEPERYILMGKQCVQPHSAYEVINYFLMRIFGRDFHAAAFLARPDVELDLFPGVQAGTFCKNSIDYDRQDDTYLCESLVEVGNHYHLVITAIGVMNRKVCSFRRISAFRVSPMEASLMLARSEFVTVYQVIDDPESFNKTSTRLTRKATVTDYDSGMLYMMFREDNSHVDQREYRLNEDVQGLYFISAGSQLIAAAYSLSDIHLLERNLTRSAFGQLVVPIARYEFKEPVLYEFIQSGFDDFEVFVEAIRSEDD